METRRQGLTLITALCVLIGVVVVIQLWLLGAAVDALLGDDRGVLLPSALVSAALFALNGGLLWYVLSFDERVRRSRRDG
jgi:membrane associated rhomboid family serine protease